MQLNTTQIISTVMAGLLVTGMVAIMTQISNLTVKVEVNTSQVREHYETERARMDSFEKELITQGTRISALETMTAVLQDRITREHGG